MGRVLITGANRGLGLEFVRQCLERGDHVFAACRRPDEATDLHELARLVPERTTILPLDVTDDDSIVEAWRTISARVDGLDLLVNNAGIYRRDDMHDADADHPDRYIDREIMAQTWDANVTGPLRVAQQFVDLLRRGDKPRIVSLSSLMGSIERKAGAGAYSYSASKAALNMVMHLFSFEVAADGVVCVVMSPGWVKTDMGGAGASLTPEHSVRTMLAAIRALGPRDNGRFLDRDGSPLPW